MFFSRPQLFHFSLFCFIIVILISVHYPKTPVYLSEVEQDEIDLKTIEVKGNKTEIFEKWRRCAHRNWLQIEDSAEFWKKFARISEKCDQESGVEEGLGVVSTRNRDDSKHFVLPKHNIAETNLITLGIGADISAELSYERKMKKLGNLVKFYGADPIRTRNARLYSTIGTYFPFAVSMKNGSSMASVLLDNRYTETAVQHVDILSFIEKRLKMKRIDNLWIDAEFAEYELFPIFERNGLFDKNGIEACQVNLEIHLNQFEKLEENPNYQEKFMKFLKKIIADGKFGVFRATEALHLRVFMFNFESEYCRNRF